MSQDFTAYREWGWSVKEMFTPICDYPVIAVFMDEPGFIGRVVVGYGRMLTVSCDYPVIAVFMDEPGFIGRVVVGYGECWPLAVTIL